MATTRKDLRGRTLAAGVHGAYRQSPGLLPLVAVVRGAAGNGLPHW